MSCMVSPVTTVKPGHDWLSHRVLMRQNYCCRRKLSPRTLFLLLNDTSMYLSFQWNTTGNWNNLPENTHVTCTKSQCTVVKKQFSARKSLLFFWNWHFFEVFFRFLSLLSIVAFVRASHQRCHLQLPHVSCKKLDWCSSVLHLQLILWHAVSRP